jgi:hypothetical protein
MKWDERHASEEHQQVLHLDNLKKMKMDYRIWN